MSESGRTGNPQVILDTNTIIYSIRSRLDLGNAIAAVRDMGDIVIPECVLDELNGLSEKVADARAGIKLAQRFKKVTSTGKGDECIILKAIEIGAVVVTNDRELIRRLKDSGIRVASIRGGRTIDYV